MSVTFDSRVIIFLNYCYSVFNNIMNELYVRIGIMVRVKKEYNFQACILTCFGGYYNYSVSVGEVGA